MCFFGLRFVSKNPFDKNTASPCATLSHAVSKYSVGELVSFFLFSTASCALHCLNIMSGLNASLGYFLAIVGVSAVGRVLFARWRPRWTFLTEFIAAFALAACRLEVDTIAEVGQWAGALGPDVAITMLFLSITVHAIIMQGISGNPSVTLMELLQKDLSAVAGVLSVAAQLLGAYFALVVAGKYWEMELTDMHMIKNLMMAECSTSLRVPPLQGVFAEALGAMTFHLVYLALKNRSQLLRIPIFALLLTFIAYAGGFALDSDWQNEVYI